MGLQWVLWDFIAPFVWFLFFPAIFLCARLGGLTGGIAGTLISATLVYFFFMPPRLSWSLENPFNYFSIVVFVLMGYLFSDIQERYKQANRRLEDALNQTRAANEEIQQLYHKTLELNELKAQFFANVSHELRTPLTLILSPIRKILQTAQLDEEARRDLQVAERNARFLHRHVNDLLNLSKLDAGHMQMRYTRVDLAHIVRVVASQFEGAAAERAIHFSVAGAQQLEADVDMEKFQLIALNLLSNAFKFTPEQGEIELSLAASDGQAVLQVRDSGPGIPPGKREAIFERFLQLDGVATRKHGGTGLGLSIVKEYVALHNGEIMVLDAPGGGALFKICLPLSAPPGASVESGPFELDHERALQQLEELALDRAPSTNVIIGQAGAPLVLVVEDHPDMRAHLANLLAQKYRVASAADGKAGLAKALALSPDLILLDVMMPELSGDQLLRALRQHPDLAATPIVVLTAKLDEALRLELLRGGAQDYIHKPFTEDELIGRVANLLAIRQQAKERLNVIEQQYHNLFENMSEGVAYCQMLYDNGQAADWIYLDVNAAFENLTGLRSARGKRVSELIPNIREADPALFAIYERVAAGGAQEKFEFYLNALKMWFSVSVYSPARSYFIAVFDVITERKQAEEALKQSEASLKFSQRVAHVGHWTWDTRTNRVTWSDEMYRIFGLEPAGTSEDLSEVIARAIHPDDRDKVNQSNETVLHEQKPEPLEYRVIWPDQSVHTVWAEAGEKILDENGNIIRLSGIVQDITERVRAKDEITRLNVELEQRVVERTAELQEVNAELESFAYSVSHDLRAPLRAMEGFSKILLEDYQEQVDEQGKFYITRIQDASLRMGKLIEDLLNLSRITRHTLALEEVDLGGLAWQIAGQLQKEEPQRQVEFDIPAHLTVLADANLIKIALENLLRNAFKFSGKRELARIQVGAGRQDGETHYFVRDNGAGFDMQYAGQLFTPFQRLHRANEYPGTGIGLTIVKRIITRHGGRIWCEAAVDQGATFYFTLKR